ncbi:1,3-beta-glucanosyltransferase [Parastagonospora nodorum]|nr:1,3-beta-glucanosyltransferase [Parastagonospora nodorum]KAH4220689.1 1,3-beta-glucanosyltransferase [Parastagonospora nodorum]KAH4237516.1 1,3-beta-glucanosyltransferase [Parastagonospora nodorum]KAH4808740.1 1,3-beta-glucanosyltransferase [Parastagonospora nodorum]KAH4906024.1 1,3-beta-glucanosyltransferase [Parastagonospora nodorum]
MKIAFTWLLYFAAFQVAWALDFATTRGPFLVNNATQSDITINGIWYSLSNSTTDTNAMDPLKDAKACTRDAALMAQAGINTIYVMAIDPKVNHDDCFSIFNSVGIYVVVVLRKDGVFGTSQEDFEKSYTTEFLKGMFEAIDAVKGYDNLLGFDLGVHPTYAGPMYNTSTISYADTMKMYRAFVRDTKEYIAQNAARPILVGTTLHLIRNDELLDASYQTESHMYYFYCGEANDPSRSDYISFYNIGFFETSPVEKQNASYQSYQKKAEKSLVPTWFSYMGIFDEADYVEYELRPDLLNDTLFLFNSSSQLVRPNGLFTGGVRVSWTNTNMGWKVPGKANWGLTTTTPNGDVQLTPNYDAFRSIIDQVNPGSWLSGTQRPVQPGQERARCDANAKQMANKTLISLSQNDANNITLATDWALPTRPPGVDAMIENGVGGKTGRMVDVTATSVAFAVRDSKGGVVTDLALKPSSSQARGPTGSGAAIGMPKSSGELSTGAKAGVGVGAGVSGLALIGAMGFLLLRRRKKRKSVGESDEAVKKTKDVDGYHKAELAAGREVEKQQAELDASGIGPQEVMASERKYELCTAVQQEPVELPVTEKPVEAPGR